MTYFKWENRKKSWKPISVNGSCCCHYSLLLFVLELVTRDSTEIISWLSCNGSIVLTLCLHYPLLKALLQCSPYFLIWSNTTRCHPALKPRLEVQATALLSPGMLTHLLCLFSFFPQFSPCAQKTKTSTPMTNDSLRKNQRDFELILAQLPQEEWPQKS